MTSYRNEVGAWDGGPPGAEGDYAPLPAVPPPAPMPTTDPWTGVSYTQYPSNYDYQSYGAPPYGYSYESSSYYQRADSYYDAQSTYSRQYQSGYGYIKPLDQPTLENHNYSYRRSMFKSKSRSGSPYERRDREYSKCEYSQDRHKSKNRSSKRKYTPSRSSSRSKSRSPVQRKRRSASSDSDTSKNSYQNSHKNDRSMTPSDKMRKSKSFHGSSSESSQRRSRSISPRYRVNKEKWNTTYKIERSQSKSPGPKLEKKSPKVKEERNRTVSPLNKPQMRLGLSNEKNIKSKQVRNLTPPRRNVKSPPARVKVEKRSVTPSKRRKGYDDKATTPKRNKYRDRTFISDRPKESSVTPPRCYARSHSSSKSRSSRSLTPKEHLRTRSRRHSSSSSSDSYARKTSRSRSKKRSKRKSIPREKSSSRSPSRERHRKSRSKSRHRSRTHRSSSNTRKSRSSSSHSSSRSGTKTPSDDERRGQFTVADRKRYWKLHRHNQGRAKSPKEIKPPPGAVETTKVDDIGYGDPPEVEGPNFAELLSPPSLVSVEGPSNSKINKTPLPIPIKNDGSFLEMFKKLQKETTKQEIKKPEIKKPILPFIGKRRGGRVLKTGLVKKPKAIDEQTIDNTPKDAWSLYMQEVKKYRETSCEEERKTRPLVK